MAIAKCVVCKRDVNTNLPGSAQQVTGWVTGGGAVKKSTPTGKWAHNSCLDGRVIDANQMTLEDFL